jgi:hypothetical protein
MRLLRGVHPDVSSGCIRNAAQGDPGEAAKLPGVYDLYSGVQVQGDCYYRDIIRMRKAECGSRNDLKSGKMEKSLILACEVHILSKKGLSKSIEYLNFSQFRVFF